MQDVSNASFFLQLWITMGNSGQLWATLGNSWPTNITLRLIWPKDGGGGGSGGGSSGGCGGGRNWYPISRDDSQLKNSSILMEKESPIV